MRRVLAAFLTLFVCLTALGNAQVKPSAPPPAGPAASKPAADLLPFKATETTLANGLKVIVVPTGFPNIVSLQIPVQTGSRNEVEPGRSGFAHFFEHLMFRGTPTYPPEKYVDIMTKAGARENASTSDDFTTFYCTFSKDDLDTILRVYADMFQHLEYLGSRFQDRVTGDPGRVQQEQREPARETLRSPAREGLFRSPVQAHDDGLPQGHRGHAQSVRVLEGVLQPVVPSAVHDRRGGRRRRPESRGADGRAGTGASGKPATAHRS